MEDHSHFKTKNPNPRENANLLSVFTLFYTFPTFFHGYRKNITEDDIYETFSVHKCSNLGNAAIGLWKDELKSSFKNKTKPLLRKVLIKLLFRDYVLIGAAVALVELFIKPTQIYFLGELIMCYSESVVDKKPFTYAVGVITCTLITTLISHPMLMESYHLSLKIRVICGSLIYRKVLKLSKAALSQTTSGQIINLISNDINVFHRIVYTSQYLWAGPVQTIIILYMMYKEVGLSCLFGVALLLTFIPLYSVMGKMATKYRLKASNRRDQRLHLLTEIIQGIAVIKMYAWEKSFSKIIGRIRNLEVRALKVVLLIKSVYLLHPTCNTTALFLTIVTSALLNQALTAKSLFMVTNMFFVISSTLNFTLPQAMIFLSEISVSMNRMTAFLLCEETQMTNVTSKISNAVKIQNGFAKWEKSSPNYVLSSLNFEIRHGNLTAIIGSVGSGKSSLLNIMLGELPLTMGTLHVNGTVSYASQETWIFHATIRQNILFGSEMDPVRYNNVVKCCALEQDFKLFQYGDKTVVGEKGTSLSGGQKSRIGLARAIYRKSDIYLLDDPLSAVDTHVSSQIFEECIKKFLKSKTVVLVTHQLQYLKHVGYIIVVDKGSIIAKGPGSDLEKSGLNFVNYLERSEDDSVKKRDNAMPQIRPLLYVNKNNGIAANSTKRKFISLNTYKGYFFASKRYTILALSVICYILAQLTISASSYFLAYWVNNEQDASLKRCENQRNVYVYVYCGITVACVTFTILRSICFVNLAMKSSRVLHDTIFKNVVYATLAFFYSNSSGIILNRFAKDLTAVDELLPNAIMVALRTILSIIGTYCVICFVNPWFLAPTVLMMLTLYYLRKFYLTTSLSILRSEGRVRGPLYSYLNTSLQGLSTIRAFGMQKILTKEYYEHQDKQSSAIYMALSTSRAFSYWIDLITVIFIIILATYYILNDNAYGGNVGLVITQALQLINQLSWCVRHTTDVENYMISVERVLDYNLIPIEQNIVNFPKNKPSGTWPDHGKITFKHVFLRYSQDLPYVLKNLCFVIRPQEKVGIVGRTGAGKSTIISALFQLIETEGLIVIDEINIQSISLQELRLKISVIPQDPVLFTGSVRSNLDPFNEYDDDVLWNALEEVRLKNLIADLSLGLNFEILQEGSNFSVGQRQLICLARAIVRNNKILILDEATANVDLETDQIIQETIQKRFSNCTVLTVAHRLNTIINSDKVLVMDAGIAVEFDHPYLLLQNRSGLFYNLVQQTEKAMTDVLIGVAEKNYKNCK